MDLSKISISILKNMFLTRFCDQKMDILVKQNKGSSFFLSCMGHEIIGSIFASLLDNKKDFAFPYYRDRAFALGYGCSLLDIIAAFLARDVKNHSGGRMMLDHFCDKEKRIPVQSSVVGSQFLQATGVAKSIRLKKENGIVYVSCGDGACSQGDFYEALNFSSIHMLPIIFVVQDNNFAISTPIKEQTAAGCIYEVVKNFPNVNAYVAEGKNFEDFFIKAFDAIKKAYMGPVVFVGKVPRLQAHTISDDPSVYKSLELMEKEKLEDPLMNLEKWVVEKDYIKKEDIDKVKQEIKQEVEKVSIEAEKIPFAKNEKSSFKVFKDFDLKQEPIEFSEKKITILKALNNTLIEEMEENKNILVFGQDVAGEKGGVFQVTKNLSKKFGNRCFNTPLAESTIVGLAIGLSFNGFIPIAEIQFSDYCWTGINQLANELSSIYYRSNGQYNCPIVIRMTCGGYVQGGPYHSQSLEAIFAHVPGLKVVIPSNSMDAKLLLKSAIKDPNPVIFLEHKVLYRNMDFCFKKEAISGSIPLGKANIIEKGKDLTLVSWGMTVPMSYQVIKEIKEFSIELIDLRTINPLDIDTILESIKKTNRLLIVHEAWETGGFGAEICARIADIGFTYLDAPIKRIGAKNCPIAFCKVLENEILPQKEDIKEAIFELLEF